MISDLPMRTHPCLDIFPLMAEDELDALASSIRANGLIMPVVVDRDGVLLDGRCRLEACRRAGVAPRFRTYDGDSPVAYILSANVVRASYPRSVRAMVVARAGAPPAPGTLTPTDEAAAEDARVVLRWAPELADGVRDGWRPLAEALEAARERRAQADAEARLRERIRLEAPDLHEDLGEGRLTLVEAVRTLVDRQRRAQQARDAVARQTRQLLALLDPDDAEPETVDERAAYVLEHLRPETLLPKGTRGSAPVSARERLARCAAVLGAILARLDAPDGPALPGAPAVPLLPAGEAEPAGR